MRTHLEIVERNGSLRWKRAACSGKMKEPTLTLDPAKVTCVQCRATRLFRQATEEGARR